ncbi:uncharacterized protein LOC119694200 [Plutella xylostella]|uniref:uncharacterized protein LOC119694200 n=1 Tax=Plutella xylostella TaxID=51655 RepID=UPI002032D3C8|nr:uncharacterized protein LOC119694200 [Plutella xylostella]
MPRLGLRHSPEPPRSRSRSRGVTPRRSRSRERRSTQYDDGEPHRRRSKRSRRSKRRRRDKSHSRSRSRMGSSSASPHNRRENQGADTRYLETQTKCLEGLVNVLKNFKNTNERDKFPVLHNVIPEFDPLCKEQSIDVWLHKIEECAKIYGWDESQITHYALPKLTGVAKSWYQGLPSLMFSWPEWQTKLRETFPSRINYAEILTDMLGRKVRYGESLEMYYYSKINLLNRCEITGQRAVDCLIYGIEDRSVKLGAQAAEFTEPEQLLKFLKTVKVGQDRNNTDQNKSKDKDRRAYLSNNSNPTNNNPKTSTPTQKSNYSRVTCYNCNEIGHPYFRCTKPKVQCTTCNLRGHVATDCKTTITNADNKTKSVLQIENNGDTSSKYKMPVKINGMILNCHVDLGSEGTLIRVSDAKRLNLEWKPVGGPLLRGIGNVPYCPLGVIFATVEVQGVTESEVEILVVDDSLINCPVLLGHTYTERPTINITKTDSDVIIKKVNKTQYEKCELICAREIIIKPSEINTVSVKCAYNFSGTVYVNGSVRGCIDKSYYFLPGEYDVKQGLSSILVQNVSNNDIIFKCGDLLTRSRRLDRTYQVNKVDCCFDEISDKSSIKCGNQVTTTQKETIKDLLDKYSSCFSTGLSDLGFTTETEMVIDLIDAEPVVYRPYRMSQSEREKVRVMVDDMLQNKIIRESNSPYMLALSY